MAIILLGCGPCVVFVNCWDRFCTLGRAPRTKDTLSDFHEWCRVTRHPRVFRGLMGCQWTPGIGESHMQPTYGPIMSLCYKYKYICTIILTVNICVLFY